MQKSQKSQLTCSYCSKILKDPIALPCEDSICREHSSESDIVKENIIKCNQEFLVNDNHFKSNETLQDLKESHSYLSGEQISLKQELEVSIRNFFEFYDEFIQNRAQLESNVFGHFQD